nr:AAA family ATPase [Desulfobulbaceae bacterium]
MTEIFTKAKFWKCALQVNPSNYIAYRGGDHGMTEERYNQELVRVALENNIKVIGLADHGNVEGVDAIRTVMNTQGIIVFPGFEIASTEKAHFVCLFDEKTSTDQLNRYLGALGLTDPKDGIYPSNKGGNDLIAKVEELGGFIYAAHCEEGSGVLKQKLCHVWSDINLRAAQIKGTLDELKNDEENRYRKILLNKDPAYEREIQMAIINAKDVAKPEDLANPRASCLIKMTNPSFEAFKLAFKDPESRVRLNSDVSEKYFSHIESFKVTGGYLDGVHISFSDHLNTVIGGRGTGKSTLLECIRYVLERRPIGKNAEKQHDEIIKENLGKSKARVELVVRSSKMNGKRFTLARRYGETTSVTDDNGAPSSFTPKDLLPEIEIYGQNEIFEIAQNKISQSQLLSRFLEIGQHDSASKIQFVLKKLSENRQKLIDSSMKMARVEDEVARLPKLEEQVGQFISLGLEDKLKIVPLLEKERGIMSRALEEEGSNLNNAFEAVKDSLPDTTFLSDHSLEGLPHAETFRKIKKVLDKLSSDAGNILSQWDKIYIEAKTSIDKYALECSDKLQKEEETLEKTYRDLPCSEGKTGKEIGIEYQRLIKEIEQIRPKKLVIENHRKLSAELNTQRQSILGELSAIRADHSAQFERSLKELNKRLKGKLRLDAKAEFDRRPVIDFLLQCNLDGVGEGRLSWIESAEDFSPVKLAQFIREGASKLRSANWSITPTVADALVRLTKNQVLELEELECPDVITIELNTAHEGKELFKPLEKLSTGQQCTAILHLLLLQNLDPLIMDQPEDNLDNAFIADRIVTELRSAKIARQFIFATHNANIPVFGDAEWIGVFEVSDGQAQMPRESQGAIDVSVVRDKAAIILEGGKAAFNQRKSKYGF